MLSKSCLFYIATVGAVALTCSFESVQAEQMTFGMLSGLGGMGGGGTGGINGVRTGIMQAEKNVLGFSPYAAMAGVDGINNPSPSTGGGNGPVSAPSGPTMGGGLPNFINSVTNNQNNASNTNTNNNSDTTNSVNTVNGVTTQSTTTTNGAPATPDECGPAMTGRRLRTGCKGTYQVGVRW
ncbi:hypothetical protein Gpo141_00010495 [Globisporangium polare]